MWTYRRTEKNSRLDKVTNESVLRRVNEDRQILNSIWQQKHRWFGHVLRHNGLLHEITEGRMRGKPTTGRRRIQTLHDLANDDGFVALKRQLKTERYGNTENVCQKNFLQWKTTELNWIEHCVDSTDCVSRVSNSNWGSLKQKSLSPKNLGTLLSPET